ncbi:MAG: hypothetical protein R2751_08215 [Bacteroidales bacterium]
MEEQASCETCAMRAKYDAKPRSFGGRFWRWHINWCPGWKKYMASLDETKKAEIVKIYGLKS